MPHLEAVLPRERRARLHLAGVGLLYLVEPQPPLDVGVLHVVRLVQCGEARGGVGNYLEGGSFAPDGVSHYDLGVVVLEDAQQAYEGGVLSGLSREVEAVDVRECIQARKGDVAYTAWILKGWTCLLRVINARTWHNCGLRYISPSVPQSLKPKLPSSKQRPT